MRQDVDGAEQREADQHVGEYADAEIAPLEQAQIDERLFYGEFDGDECCEEHRRHDRQAKNEGRGEPIVLVAFLEHGLQRRQPDRHGDDAGPIAFLQKESCIGLRSSVKASATTITMLGGVLTKKIVCQP